MEKSPRKTMSVRSHRSRRTLKRKVVNKDRHARKMVRSMLEMLPTIKFYHWTTGSYATHKATDGIYGKLNDHMDSYVETMLGKFNNKLKVSDFKTLNVTNIDSNEKMEKHVNHFINELRIYNQDLDQENDSDLLNIGDEIVADLNVFLYLLRLK